MRPPVLRVVSVLPVAIRLASSVSVSPWSEARLMVGVSSVPPTVTVMTTPSGSTSSRMRTLRIWVSAWTEIWGWVVPV